MERRHGRQAVSGAGAVVLDVDGITLASAVSGGAGSLKTKSSTVLIGEYYTGRDGNNDVSGGVDLFNYDATSNVVIVVWRLSQRGVKFALCLRSTPTTSVNTIVGSKLVLNIRAATGTVVSLQDNFTNEYWGLTNAGTMIGPAWKPAANGTTALQMQQADGTAILNVDTTNKRVGVGATAPATALHTLLTDAGTNAVVNVATIGHDTSGTATTGFGAGIAFQLESSTTAAQNAGQLAASWTDATHATRTSKVTLSLVESGTQGVALEVTTSTAAVGVYALVSNTGANANAFGYAALLGNTGPNSNGMGAYALNNNSGTNSNAIGYVALQNNTGAHSNAIGAFALQNNTGAYSNAIGAYALQNNTGAYSNAIGYAALLSNTGEGATAFGHNALYGNTGTYSSAFGYACLQENTGANNNAFGYTAMVENRAGTGNIAFGHQAGRGYTDNNYCVFLGYDARTAAGTLTNSIVIGANARSTKSNQVWLGHTDVNRDGAARELCCAKRRNLLTMRAAASTQGAFGWRSKADILRRSARIAALLNCRIFASDR